MGTKLKECRSCLYSKLISPNGMRTTKIDCVIGCAECDIIARECPMYENKKEYWGKRLKKNKKK